MTEKQENKKEFQGVWIPKEIWENTELKATYKILLVEIKGLDNAFGCVANNRYFAEFMDLSADHISKMINDLAQKGYINITYKNDKTCEGRVIKINKIKFFGIEKTPSENNVGGSENDKGGSENNVHINKSINTSIISSLSNTPAQKIENEDWKSEIINHPMFEISKDRTFSNLDQSDIDYTLELYKTTLRGNQAHFTQAMSWLKNASLDKTKAEKVKAITTLKPYQSNYNKQPSSSSYEIRHPEGTYDIIPMRV